MAELSSPPRGLPLLATEGMRTRHKKQPGQISDFQPCNTLCVAAHHIQPASNGDRHGVCAKAHIPG